MKAVVAAFNQEKALVGAFSVITNLRMELFEALLPGLQPPPCSCDLVTAEAVTSCQLGGATLQLEDALPQLDCARAEISAWTNESTVFVGTRVTLDCDWSAWPRPTIAWLTPRHELLVHRAEPAGDQQQCPG